MADLITNIEQMGIMEESAGAAPIDLAQEGIFWVVVQGKVDIFASQRNQAEEFGSRYHILRIEQGAAFFGLPRKIKETALIAISAPGTKLLRLNFQVLEDSIEAADENARKLLEDWLAALSTRLCVRKAPSNFIDAGSADSIAVPEEARAILVSDGIRWATHHRGHSIPLADDRLSSVNGSGYFPVSRFSWLQASPSSELRFIPTETVPQVDPGWSGLRQFYSSLEELLHLELQDVREKEKSRLHQRSTLDRTFVENALEQLSTPIQALSLRLDRAQSCRNPVFLALQAVAGELGIQLTAPREMLRNESIPDPISAICKVSSIRVRKVALRGAWWKTCNEPLVGFLEETHRPIAILLRSSSRIEIHDPVQQTFVTLSEEAAAELSPIAYTLYRPFPFKALKAIDLLKFGFSHAKGDLALIATTGAAAGLLAVVYPVITSIVFDHIIPGAERDQLVQMTLLLLVSSVAGALFTFVRGFASLRLQGKLDASVQSAVWDRLLALPVSFFRNYSSGDLAQRSMGISQIREILTGSALNAIISGIFSIFSFVLLFYYSVKLASIGTGLVALACLITMLCGISQLRYRRQILTMSGALSSKLLQFIGGIAKFRVSGTEGRAFAAWAHDFSKQKKTAVQARRISNWLAVFTSSFPVVSLAAIFYANARFFTKGHSALSTGEFLAFLAAFTQFLSASLTLSNTILNVLSIVPIYERAAPIFQALPESSEGRSDPGVLKGDIEISHITFSYRPETPLVLRDLTLKIHAGQAVAFVGASGCGKSTLFRMLLGFERPSSGTIYYDGQDLEGLDVKAVRRQIGVVLQTSRPISGSIFENIVGSSPLSVDDAWEACRLAGLDEDIRRMPMGLHTNISDGGGGISGGQRQRLMIARAIVGRPRILLFDEATSALDNRTQAIVSRSLAGLNATRIVIAHRLSTVVDMDKIFVLDKGSIAESGTYTELMEKQGLFYALAKRQLV